MFVKTAAVIVLGASVFSFGQATLPTTRPGTAGAIAPTIDDVGPLQKGASVPAVVLTGSDGTSIDLRSAVLNKPAILIFYRGGWCQNCVRQLRGIEGVLTELTDAGYQVLAISPDTPERLRATIEESRLTYPLLSDANAVAMKAFGVAHLGTAGQFEMLEKASGASHHAIPVPSIYVLGTDGTVRFTHFDPTYTNKLSYSDLIERAKAALIR